MSAVSPAGRAVAAIVVLSADTASTLAARREETALSDRNYPRLFRGGDPERTHDDVSDRSRDESELEQTSIRPHQTSQRTSKEAIESSAQRNTSSSQRRSGDSQESGKRAAPRRTRDTSGPKHAAGSKRALDRSFRRCATLTVASTLLPGLGLAGARQRWAKILGCCSRSVSWEAWSGWPCAPS